MKGRFMRRGAAEEGVPGKSPRREHRKWIVFLILAAALLLAVLFARQLCPWDPYQQDLSRALQPPSTEHLFGTDRYGRDMLSRVIIGSRTSVTSALILVAIISVMGTALGIVAGYLGGIVDGIIMRVSDICLAFPGLVFAMAIAAVLNGGVESAVLALAAVSWPKYARIARSQTLALKDAEFMQAARLSGCNLLQLIFRQRSRFGTDVFPQSGRLFPFRSHWHHNRRSMLQTYPWVVLTPGLAVFVSVTVFNLLGDAVRDALDPRGITRM